MNDTHPALAVAELMRVLVDENNLEWEEAWEITQKTVAYTNHTLLPEALEKWSVALMERVLPRHMQIIYGINHNFLRTLTAYSWVDGEKVRKMSVIEEGHDKNVRMAHLAIVASHAVNGVSALHSELIRTSLVPEFAQLGRKIQQQDQRRGATALAAQDQPSSVAPALREHRRRLDHRPRGVEEAGAAGQRCRLSAAFCRSEGAEQAAAGAHHPR